MKLNVKKNAIRNMLWGFVNKVILTILPFGVRTIIIQKLGAEYVGLNGFYSGILSVLNISDLGISSAIVYTMYGAIARDNKEEICALLNFYRKCYRVIVIIVALMGLLLLPFLRYFINGEIPAGIDIYILYFIYLFNVVSGYTFFAYRDCLFTAHQQNDKIFKIQTLSIVLQYVIQIIVVLLYSNYYLYAMCLPITTIVYNLLVAYRSKRTYPLYIPRGKVTSVALQDIKKQVMGIFIGKINTVVRNSLDSVFISSYLGLIVVGMYSNYYMIASSVMGLIDIISVSLVAGIGNRVVLNTKEENFTDYNNLYFCAQWIVGFCAICVLCLIQPFMKLWVGTDLLFENAMAVICAMYVLVGKINLIGGVYSGAIGIWWQMKIFMIIDIPINLLTNWIFVYKWGAYGIVLATVLVMLVYSLPFSQWIFFKNYFGAKNYFRSMVKIYYYLFVTAAIGAVTYGICQVIGRLVSSDWLQLIVNLLICLTLANGMYWIVYHKSEYYRSSIAIIKNIGEKFTRKIKANN